MLDKQTIQNFRKDFAEAVKDLEQQYGFVIELGNIRYSATDFTGKLLVKEGESKDQVNEDTFKAHCREYGLAPTDYDRRFTYEGKDYVITGIRPSKHKYPICCLCLADQKTYGFTAKGVKNALNK